MPLDDEHGVEDVVPDLAGDTEAEVEVLVVMREVVFLHIPHVRGKSRVMEAIVKRA